MATKLCCYSDKAGTIGNRTNSEDMTNTTVGNFTGGANVEGGSYVKIVNIFLLNHLTQALRILR